MSLRIVVTDNAGGFYDGPDDPLLQPLHGIGEVTVHPTRSASKEEFSRRIASADYLLYLRRPPPGRDDHQPAGRQRVRGGGAGGGADLRGRAPDRRRRRLDARRLWRQHRAGERLRRLLIGNVLADHDGRPVNVVG